VYQTFERLNAAGRPLARMGLLRLVNYFPPSTDLPARPRAEYKAFADSVRFADPNAAEFGATPATAAQLRAAGGLGARPLVVLSATEHGAGGGAAGAAVSEQVRQLEQQWQGWQRELAAGAGRALVRPPPPGRRRRVARLAAD
jgi:hypothetical protein